MESLLGRWLPVLATLALVAWLALLAARATWAFAPGETAGSAPLPPAPVTARALAGDGERPGPEQHARRIAGLHLFGEAEQPAPEADAIDAPETRLNLTLRGVLAGGGQAGLALIAQGREAEQIYAVGDRLPGGAELARVHADRVILQRAGRFETLRLPEQGLGEAATAPRKAAGAGRASAPDTAVLRRLRSQALRNPARLAQQFRAMPVREGGRVIGYRLRDLQGAGTLSAMGLQPDDVILSVNGQQLAQVPNPGTLYRRLKEAETFDLRVRRNGTEIPVTLSLR